jgi:hypothetical protein
MADSNDNNQQRPVVDPNQALMGIRARLAGAMMGVNPNSPDYLKVLERLGSAQHLVNNAMPTPAPAAPTTKPAEPSATPEAKPETTPSESALLPSQPPGVTPQQGNIATMGQPHRGLMGKIGHGLLRAADVAGSVLAPEAMMFVPGSSIYKGLTAQREAGQRLAEEKIHEPERVEAMRQNAPVKPTADEWSVIPQTRFELNKRTGETREMSGLPPLTPKPGPEKEYIDPSTKQAFYGVPVEGQGVKNTATGQIVPGALAPSKPATFQKARDRLTGRDAFVTSEQIAANPDRYEPQPVFAETGLWEPTMIKQGDQYVPGRFDKRTGHAEPLPNAAAVAVPKEVSAAVDTAVKEGTDTDKLYQGMVDSLPQALKGDQQQMINLLTAHVGMTMGQIPGRRLNQEFFREAQESMPWLQKVQARFDDRGYLSGVVLSPQQMHFMVGLGEQRRVQAWQRVWDTEQKYGFPVVSTLPADIRQQIVGAGPLGGPGGGVTGGALEYATDPQGKLHSAPAGTALPKGWKKSNAPAR